MEMHSHLSALNETRNDWFLRVRVTRIWNNTTSSGILIRYNMILLDCENNYMHAVVALELWNLFAGIITPGTIYCIRNMNVSPATGLFRPVHSKDMIHFTASTTVVLDLNNDLFIPRHKFHITPLNELRDSFYFYGPENQPVYSTDVVGVVENLEAMRTVQTRHGSRDLMRFNISDGLNRHCVSFYSPFSEHYEALYETQLENLVIVILASTRVSVFRNIYVIGNLPSTKIYINIDDPQVFLMRQRTTWKIKARVTRMWPSVSVTDNGTETMKGYNLVLLDDADCHVHVFVYADN
ncbi:replication protein A 70 kDa DNA-binding subunit A-like [Apium graveolens]|uniref:replication protein A 70 kDa DNA-binding subunit A-like n=1 Tax=Apium graveolens TaxID=4045 RepID=UPI003D7AAADA